VALIDSPEGRQLTGVPFAEEVTETLQATLALRLTPLDAFEGDTLFDDIDFSALPTNADGLVRLEAAAPEAALVDAYHSLRRTFQTHDHYVVSAESEAP
jgi:hypothetical protein